MRLVSATLSKPGGQDYPQDAIALPTPAESMPCWAIADGHGSGVASAQQAVNALRMKFAANPAISPPVLTRTFEAAQEALFDQQDSAQRASAALFCTGGRSVLWGHVGNVRVYAFRDGQIVAQSKDHSGAQALADAGQITVADIRGHSERHRLLRFIGAMGMVQPTITQDKFVLRAGDLFLLCTDGFWEHVSELEMLIDWCKSRDLADWLGLLETRLLRVAPPGHDSYSAIALLAEV